MEEVVEFGNQLLADYVSGTGFVQLSSDIRVVALIGAILLIAKQAYTMMMGGHIEWEKILRIVMVFAGVVAYTQVITIINGPLDLMNEACKSSVPVDQTFGTMLEDCLLYTSDAADE